MSAPGNPFADLAQQQTQADNGNPFAPLTNQQAPQQTQEQAGFLQRAYEGSPIPGILDAGKAAITEAMSGPMMMQNRFNDMVDSLKSGNFQNAAAHAAELLTGDANPFSDAAKSVINGVVKDAHQAGRDIATKNISAIPVVGTALNNLATDVKAKNYSGAAGDVVGGASSLAPLLLGDEANAAKAQAAVEGAANAAGEAVGKAKTLVSEDAASTVGQPEVQSAVRDVAKATEPTAIETPSIRSAVENAGDQVYARSKDAYAQLDAATGGRYQRFTDQIKNLQQKMNEVAGIDDDAYESYELKRNDIETTQNNLVEQLVQDGKIDPKLADQAKADFKQSMAMYDLDAAVKSSTKGVRPEQANSGSTAEFLDPAKLDVRLQKLNDSGRLAQAVGKDGATQLIQRVDGALRSRTTAISRAKFVKAALKYTGYGTAVAIGGSGLAHVLGSGGSK